MAKDVEQEVDFEQALEKLDRTVQTLEAGGLTLAQATSLFEEGMRLAKTCGQRLDTAELKVTELQNAFLNQVEEREDVDE